MQKMCFLYVVSVVFLYVFVTLRVDRACSENGSKRAAEDVAEWIKTKESLDACVYDCEPMSAAHNRISGRIEQSKTTLRNDCSREVYLLETLERLDNYGSSKEKEEKIAKRLLSREGLR